MPLRSALLLGLSIASLLYGPSPSYASRGGRGNGKPIAIHLEATFGISQLSLGDARFSGTAASGGVARDLALTGHQLGVGKPLLFDFAIHLALGRAWRHVQFGGVGGILSGHLDAVRSTTSGDPFTSLFGLYLGPEISTAWSYDWFDVRAAVAVGYQYFDVTLRGYDRMPCGKGNVATCAPSVDADGLFVRPRITVGVHKGVFGVGLYLSGNVMPQGAGVTGGLYVSLVSSLMREQNAIVRSRE